MTKLRIHMQYCVRLIITCTLALCFTTCGSDAPTSNPEPGSDENIQASVNPRFKLLQPDETGIHFSNTIKENLQNNILLNSYLYNGGGVAVIDVNNDDLPDLYFSATQESNRLFLNKGNLKFEDISNAAGVDVVAGIKTGVTVVDINADGFQDLYVCRSGNRPGAERTNLLYVNNGDLTFTERAAEYGLSDASASNYANFFDYDLDGDLDVYILNHPVDFNKVNSVSVRQEGNTYVRNTAPLNEWDSDKFYRNDGGRFTEVGQAAGIYNRAWGLSVTVSDFNGDRYPDIFVGNDYIEPDLLYINQRNGKFKVETDRYFRHQSNHTMGVDIADINNDNMVDLVALDMLAEKNKRQKELMNTMVNERYEHLVRYGYGHQIMRNVLQLNTGRSAKDGAVFNDIGVLSGVWHTDWSWSPLLADFDNDGWKDLYITNGYRRDITNLDYLMYTAPKEAPGGKFNTIKYSNIEDYLDLIPSKPMLNCAYRNVDGNNFEQVNADWGMMEPSYSNGSAYADLDADGDLDLVVNNIHGDVMVYQNNSVENGGSNWLQVVFEGPVKNPAGTGARVRITYAKGKNQYQELTPSRGFFSSSEHLLHFGLGKNKTVEKIEVQWQSDGRVQLLENIPANQRLTIKYKEAESGTWEKASKTKKIFSPAKITGLNFRHIEDAFSDFDRERLLPHKFSNLGPTIATGDVNGDGLEDFFIGGAHNQPSAIFLQTKNSDFKEIKSSALIDDAIYEDMGSAFFDADGDGDLDLYVASGGNTYEANSVNYQDRLYINSGDGSFKKVKNALPNITSSGSQVVPHDFDGDGDLDVLVGGQVVPGFYPLAPATILLKNNGGKFTDVCSEVAPELQKLGMVNDFEWVDLNGDGKAELIAVGEWLPISIFENNNGKITEATTKYGLENSTGWWNCVTTADLDGDGDLDFVAGNLGLNSRLQATDNEPLRLYAKDFDGNGSIDPVIACWEEGERYPLPLRDMMIKQMPSLKKKFVFHKDYGKATINDVFSKTALDAAQQFEANTFATAWFENVDGKFTAHKLPVSAQYAPTNDIEISDFDNDGNLDILLVGNSSSPDVETGRYDAGNGVLLRGDGNGNFHAVPNLETGFWAVREARDMASMKLANGKTLILIANNNDVLEGYIK